MDRGADLGIEPFGGRPSASCSAWRRATTAGQDTDGLTRGFSAWP